jgi:hypothetical protein
VGHLTSLFSPTLLAGWKVGAGFNPKKTEKRSENKTFNCEYVSQFSKKFETALFYTQELGGIKKNLKIENLVPLRHVQLSTSSTAVWRSDKNIRRQNIKAHLSERPMRSNPDL